MTVSQEHVSRESAEEFSNALSQVVAGAVGLVHWGVDAKIPKALGLSDDEWLQRKLTGSIRLTRPERQQYALARTAEGATQRQIADELGVAQATIGRDLSEPCGSDNAKTTNDDATSLVDVEPNGSRNTLTVDADTGEILGDEGDWWDDESDDAPPQTATREVPHVSHNSGENEWYTPPEYVEAARDVMGGIDLDPASSPIANRTVHAVEFYTAAENGLTRSWQGRVFLNPPYAQPLIQQFADKLVDEWLAEHVSEAIVLVNNATETQWFQTMAKHASAVAFPRGRVRFLDPDGNPGAPLQGQAVLYLGDQREAFSRTFELFGVVR